MSLNEKEELSIKIQKEPFDQTSFQKLIQTQIRQGQHIEAFSTALDYFFENPTQNSCYQLYVCSHQLYLSQVQKKFLSTNQQPHTNSKDFVVICPISCSYANLILLGGRIGDQLSLFQEILNPFINSSQKLILDFLNTRLLDSTCLGYLANFLEQRRKKGFSTYCVDMNKRVQVCFKYLDLYSVVDNPKTSFKYSLPHCLLDIKEQLDSDSGKTDRSKSKSISQSICSYQLIPVTPQYTFFEKIWKRFSYDSKTLPLMYEITEVEPLLETDQ